MDSMLSSKSFKSCIDASVCVLGRWYAHVIMHVWTSEDNIWESVLFIHPWVLGMELRWSGLVASTATH